MRYVPNLALVGAILGETVVRLLSILGWDMPIDGWREGMYWGGLIGLALALVWR